MITKEDLNNEKSKTEELEAMAKDIVEKLDDVNDIVELIEILKVMLVKGLVL